MSYFIQPFTNRSAWVTIGIISPTIMLFGYLLVIFTKKKLLVLQMLTLMILVGQIFFILFVYFEHLTFENADDPKAQRIWNALAFTSLAIYVTPYVCVHWIFAMKYWVIANDM